MTNARKVLETLKSVKCSKDLGEEVIERYSTSGGRYKIEVEKTGDRYDIRYYSNGRQDGSANNYTYDEMKKHLADDIESAARIDGIKYKKV